MTMTSTEVRTIAKQRGWSRDAIATLIERHSIPPIDQRTEQDWQHLVNLLDTPFSVGAIIHKKTQIGWTGIILKLLGSDSVEVLWWLDKQPTLMSVDELRAADVAIAQQYKAAFKRKRVTL
jgi:hypothetical protein